MRRLHAVSLALWLATSGGLHGIEVTLETRSSQAVQNEPFHVQVRVSGLNEVDGEFSLPTPSGFTMRDAGISQNQSFQIINGKSSLSFHFSRNYILIPQRTGNFLIGPAVFHHGGNAYRTKRLRIEVISQSVASARRLPDPLSEQEFFFGGPRHREEPLDLVVEPFLDPPTAYVNQEVRYGVDLYASAPRVHDIQVLHETKTGFWEETVDDQRHPAPEQIEREGRTVYRYRRLLSFLYPTGPGVFSLPPARMRVRYSDGWLRQKSHEVVFPELRVIAPPREGMPQGFSGVVGSVRFAMQEGPPAGLRTGVPFPLTFVLSGIGNLQTAPPPAAREGMEGFRILAPVVKMRTERQDLHLFGERLFTFMVYPLAHGSLVLPPFRFSYYDPETGQYRILESMALSLKVDAPDPSRLATNEVASIAMVEFLPEGEEYSLFPLPPEMLLVGGALSFPILLALFLVRRRQDFLASDATARRRSGARRGLRSALAACDRFLADRELRLALRELALALRQYPLDLLGEGGGTLLHGELASRLRERGLAAESVVAWQALLEEVEQGAYGGLSDPLVIGRWRKEAETCLGGIADRLKKRQATGRRLAGSLMFCLLTVTAPAAALAGTPGSEDHAARLLTAEAALASGSHSFNAFFNAGSAALKLGRPGEAIFWYERARLLYDGDPRLDAYLDAARRFSGADRYLSPVHPAVQVLFFFHYRMSRAVLIRVLVAGVAVLLVLAGFGIWLRLGRALWFRISVSVFLCALLGGSLSLVLRSRALFDPSRAVIIEAERPLASGPDPADPVLAALPAGIEVSILGNGGRMVKVMLPSGAIGYFPANALRRITGGHAPGA